MNGDSWSMQLIGLRFKVLTIHTKSSWIEIHHRISKRCLQPEELSLYCKVYGWAYGLHFFGNYSTWNQGLHKSSQAPCCRDKYHHLPWRLNLILCGFVSFFQLFDFVISIDYQAPLKFSPRRILRIWDISRVLATPNCDQCTSVDTFWIYLIYCTWADQFHSICSVDLTHPGLVEHFA